VALARVHPFGDAGLYAGDGKAAALLDHGAAPFAVRALLTEKCADCHSDKPRVPFYGRLAPASWLMERDIVEARKAMNLSAWESYGAEKQQTLAAKMVEETRARAMPPVQYRLVHWQAGLGDSDVKALADWARAMQNAGGSNEAGGEGDAARGKALFEKRCSGCHALDKNKQGPRLQGVYGRTAGTAEGYVYSAALKNAHVVWDEGTLEKWLTDPDQFIAGNEMDFLLAKAQERRDVIAYLRLTSNK
jgi:cytochrome c